MKHSHSLIQACAVLALGLCAAGVSACSEPEVLHPSPQGLNQPGPPKRTIMLHHLPVPRMGQPNGTVSKWGRPDPSSTIGTLAGPEMTQFGRIEDAMLVGDKVVVLDSYARKVRVFGLDGSPLGQIGGGGEGPGEFMSPRAIDTDPSEGLVVFDGRGRVTTFPFVDEEMSPPASFVFRGEIADGCVMDGAYFLHGLHPGDPKVIHKYTSSGKLIFSFGEAYRSGNRVIQNQMSLGRITCLEAAGTLLFAPNFLPELRAYGSDGDLLWWGLLEGFDPIELWETPRGSRMRLPSSGSHMVAGLVSAAEGDRAIFQVRHSVPGVGAGPGISILHSFYVLPGPPWVMYIGDWLPIVLYWDSLRTIGYQEDPFPAIGILTN